MIKSFQIENFQSHKDTNLEFAEGVNAIVGKSNNGKTSILRAMQFLLQAKGSVGHFLSSWALTPKGNQKEKLQLSLAIDNIVITRTKNKTENYYQIGEERYDKVGGTLPENIENALQINEISIQNQFDKHFLISSTSGEVGRYLGESVNLATIDQVLQKIKSDLLAVSKESNRTHKDYEEKGKIIESMHWVDVFAHDFEKLEKLEKQVPALEQMENSLQRLINTHENCTRTLTKYESLDVLELQVDVHTKLTTSIDSISKKITTLENLVESYKNIKSINVEAINELEQVLHKRNEVADKFKSLESKGKTLFNIIEGLKSSKLPCKITTEDIENAKDYKVLQENLLRINNNGKKLADIVKEISELSCKKVETTKNLQDTKDKIKGTVCFYCGQVIKEVRL